MEKYTVALFGHRDLNAHELVERRLYPILKELMQTMSYVEFYIGRNGEFDTFVASIIKRAQKMFGSENSELILILPYRKKDIEFYEQYYNTVIIPDDISKVHPKQAITERNRWMIERCDLLICYTEHESGGAYTALKYAQKLGKASINLASEQSIFPHYMENFHK